jgi:hypothetical protein
MSASSRSPGSTKTATSRMAFRRRRSSSTASSIRSGRKIGSWPSTPRPAARSGISIRSSTRLPRRCCSRPTAAASPSEGARSSSPPSTDAASPSAFAKDIDPKNGKIIGRVDPAGMGKPTLYCPSAFGARRWNAADRLHPRSVSGAGVVPGDPPHRPSRLSPPPREPAAMTRTIAGVVAPSVLLGFAGAVRADDAVAPDLKNPTVVSAGRGLYLDLEKHRSHCHGADGNGGVNLTRRDLSSPSHVFQAIAEGRERGSLRRGARCSPMRRSGRPRAMSSRSADTGNKRHECAPTRARRPATCPSPPPAAPAACRRPAPHGPRATA